MKKILSVSYFIILTTIVSLCCISCSNSEENNDEFKPAPLPLINYIKYGDYISSVEKVSGIICQGPIYGINYIEDTDNNRYFFYWTVEHWRQIYSIILEGNKVLFEGKLYAFDEEHMEELKKEHNFDYEMPAHAKQYVLVSPDFSLTLIE